VVAAPWSGTVFQYSMGGCSGGNREVSDWDESMDPEERESKLGWCNGNGSRGWRLGIGVARMEGRRVR
jgi:hypothetical protein